MMFVVIIVNVPNILYIQIVILLSEKSYMSQCLSKKIRNLDFVKRLKLLLYQRRVHNNQIISLSSVALQLNIQISAKKNEHKNTCLNSLLTSFCFSFYTLQRRTCFRSHFTYRIIFPVLCRGLFSLHFITRF